MLLRSLTALSLAFLVSSADGLGASSHGSPASVASRKLHPQMQRLLRERGPAKAWVYFVDKGTMNGERLAQAAQRLSPRALQRRALRRELPGVVDERDVDVYAPYVDSVLATGVEHSISSRWLNAVSVTGTESQMRAIAALPFVERIEPVRRGVVIGDSGTELAESAASAPQGGAGPFYGASGGQLDQIGVTGLHGLGFTGQGVVIGVLDTGFHRGHEAFNQPGHVIDIVAEWDFVNDDGNTGKEVDDPFSQHSHGTYILGTMGAYLPGQLVGAAYDASFVLAKTEDTSDEYEQEEDFWVAGIEFCDTNGADVVTSSLGYIDWYTQSDLDGLTAVTTVAANVATSNGIHVCNAAGNSGNDADPLTSALIAPADGLQVITVGAVDSTGTIASFSSDGPTADGRVKPEVLAEGVATATTCAFTDVACVTATAGTSLSTPLIAGAVACLIEAYPDWSVKKMRARLMRTGDFFSAHGGADPMHVRGFGIPNAYLAGFRPRLGVLGPSNGGSIQPQ